MLFRPNRKQCLRTGTRARTQHQCKEKSVTQDPTKTKSKIGSDWIASGQDRIGPDQIGSGPG